MLVYRQLKKEEVNRVDKLNSVGASKWSNEFFSDYKPNSHVIVCVDDEKDEFVGCEGYVDYPLMYNEHMVQTHRSERTLINPNYRGQGIFNSLIDECDKIAKEQNSHMSWGATAALKAFEKVGFAKFVGFKNYIFYPVKYSGVKKIGLMLSNVSLLNPVKAYKSKKSSNLPELKKLLSFGSMIKGAKNPGERFANATLRDIDYEEVRKLVKNNSKNQYCLVPDAGLFKWLEEKAMSYEKYGLYIGEEFAGYCIYKREEKANYIHIVDIHCTDAKYFTCMLDKVAEIEKKNNMHSLFVPLNARNNTHASYISEVSKLGVINIEKAGNFVIKTIHDGEGIKIEDLLLTDLWLEL